MPPLINFVWSHSDIVRTILDEYLGIDNKILLKKEIENGTQKRSEAAGDHKI